MYKTLKQIFIGTLRRQLIVGITLTVATLMALFVWNVIRQQQNKNLEQLSQQAVSLAKSIAVSSSLWVSSRDFSGLQEIVNGVVHYPDLHHAMVLDNSGQVLAHSDPALVGKYLTDLPLNDEVTILQYSSSLVDVVTPILLAKKKIGWVRIGLSSESLDAQLDRMVRDGIAFVLISIGIAILFSTIISRYLTRRLHVIQQTADAVRHGNSGLRADLQGDDEAANLAKQFNNMLDTLSQREDAATALIHRNQVMMDNALDGIHVLDAQGNLLEANNAFCRMLGYTYDEIKHLNVADWEAKMTADKLKATIAQLLDGHAVFETLNRRKDGSVIEVEVSAVGVELEGQKCLYVSNKDISERKMWERQLGQLNFALSHVNEAVYLMNEKGCFVYVNDEVCRALGYSREELLGGMSVPDIGPGWTDEKWAEHWSDIKANGFRILEAAHQAKDGHIFPVEISANYFEYAGQGYIMSMVRDITERKNSENMLRFHSNILDNVAQGIYLTRASDGIIVYANPQFERMFGYEPAELPGKHVSIVNAPSDSEPAEVAKAIMQDLARTGQWHGEVHNIKKDGTPFWCYATVSTFEHPVFGQVWVSAHEDITERKHIEENLLTTASVFGISQEAIIITDAENIIIDVNPSFTRITGYTHEEVIGKNPKLLSSGRQRKDFYASMWDSLIIEGAWRGEIWNRRKSGEIYPEMLSISLLRDSNGKILRHVAVFSDISNIKEHEAELVRIAHFDALTSIPNRMLLADRMSQAISQTSRDQCMMAVCYLDLDGFKPINDALGHQAGDEVLIEIAKRIGVTIRGGDTVARLGGDEFVVLLLGLSKGEECVATLERLLAAIAKPITVKNKVVSVSASIGVSIYPLDDQDTDTLLRHADQAMYIAKQNGKNRFNIYDVALDKRARDQNEFLKSIRLALERNQFELHYQPKVNLRTKKLVSAEALIRWRHPERGLLSPAEFLHYIDNTDLDVQVGEWVIASALAQMRLWRSTGLDIEVSINISGYHLECSGFVEKLQQQLADYNDIPFGKLQIEVLETVALNDLSVVKEIIESCRKIGVGFALDDFGTGYSSLSYLSSLPVDTLKIDQSFVRDMLVDKGDMAIVQGIIALAKAFDRQTVAEGVETEDQYQALLDMGCEIGQGYGISRPLPPNDLINWKANYR